MQPIWPWGTDCSISTTVPHRLRYKATLSPCPQWIISRDSLTPFCNPLLPWRASFNEVTLPPLSQRQRIWPVWPSSWQVGWVPVQINGPNFHAFLIQWRLLEICLQIVLSANCFCSTEVLPSAASFHLHICPGPEAILVILGPRKRGYGDDPVRTPSISPTCLPWNSW